MLSCVGARIGCCALGTMLSHANLVANVKQFQWVDGR